MSSDGPPARRLSLRVAVVEDALVVERGGLLPFGADRDARVPQGRHALPGEPVVDEVEGFQVAGVGVGGQGLLQRRTVPARRTHRMSPGTLAPKAVYRL